MGAFGTCATSINTVASHTPHHPRSSSSDSAMTHAVPAICGAALRHATAYFLMHRYTTSLLYSIGIIIMHQTIKKDRPSG